VVDTIRTDDYRKAVARTMGERGPGGLQERVNALLDGLGWLTFHDVDPLLNRAGFLDVCATRDGYLLFAELKSATGRVSDEQREWLERLDLVASRAPNVLVHVWRPMDLLDGTIERVLRGRRAD